MRESPTRSVQAIDKDVRKRVEEDAEFAKSSPEPDSEELYTEIYVDQPPPFIRAVEYEDSRGDVSL